MIQFKTGDRVKVIYQASPTYTNTYATVEDSTQYRVTCRMDVDGLTTKWLPDFLELVEPAAEISGLSAEEQEVMDALVALKEAKERFKKAVEAVK